MPLVAIDRTRRATLGPDNVITIDEGNRRPRMFRRVGSAPARAIALDRDRLVVVTAESYAPDRPAFAEYYSARSGRMLANWPLLGTASTVDLHADVLLYSARNSGGVFAMRLSDGKTTLLGPVRPNDTPQINAHGVVFQSNLYKRLARAGRVHMKFLPMPAVRRAFARTVEQLDVRYRIKAFSMDGPRVGVVLDEPGRQCDPVRFWNVPWRSFVRINMRRDVTCTEGLTIGNSIAMAGIAVEWIGAKNGTSQVIVSDGDKCIEHKAGILRTPTPPLAGDRLLLAFGQLRSRNGGGAEIMNWKTHTHVALRTSSPARALSVDQNRVALLRADGRTELFSEQGHLITRLPTNARAIALRGDQLATVVRGALEVWDIREERLLRTWPLPRDTRSGVDLHYGIAVFVAGHTVRALDVGSGRQAVLARTPTQPSAHIDDFGVAYGFNTAAGGRVRFIPFSRLERMLGVR